jgi:hypothetical protein
MDVLPPVHLRPWLRAQGFTPSELKRMLRTGDLRAVRPGAYVAGALPDEAELRHLLLVRAALEALSGEVVVSHVSAALWHGLPVWGVPLHRVHVTRNRRRSGGRCGDRVHVHSAPLGAADVVSVRGVPVTSVARTLLDVARTQPFEQAVVVADHALARELVGRNDLQDALAQRKRWPGVPQARRALAFADGGSGSVGESRSRVALARAGLPAPTLQWVVRDRNGRFVGCVDFGWPSLRAVGEFDGRIKYGRLRKPGQEPGDVVYAEKLREDDLRAQGLSVVRWTWPDLDDFAETAANLRRALRLG